MTSPGSASKNASVTSKRGQGKIKSVIHNSTLSLHRLFEGQRIVFRRRPFLPAPYNTAHHLIIFQFNIIQPILQLCYDTSVQRMIGNDQKIPVRILPGCIGGYGNRAESLSHQESDDALLPRT